MSPVNEVECFQFDSLCEAQNILRLHQVKFKFLLEQVAKHTAHNENVRRRITMMTFIFMKHREQSSVVFQCG